MRVVELLQRPVLDAHGTMMRAVIVGLALMAPIFALIETKAVPEPGFGAR